MPAYRTIPKDQQDCIAARHLGVISQRCLKWWKYLPPRTRAWYGVEDMIGDVVLHVVKMSHRFDPGKAKEVTWVFHVADNRCRTILTFYGKAMRCDKDNTAELTPLLAKRMAAADTVDRRESINAVYRMIERSAEAVCDLLEMVLEDGVDKTRESVYERYLERDPEVVEELRQVVWECDVTLEDFESVLKYAV